MQAVASTMDQSHWGARWRQSTDDTCQSSKIKIRQRLICCGNEAKPESRVMGSSLWHKGMWQGHVSPSCLFYSISCYSFVPTEKILGLPPVMLLSGAWREERGRYPKESSFRIHKSILCGSLLLERHSTSLEICEWLDTAAECIATLHSSFSNTNRSHHLDRYWVCVKWGFQKPDGFLFL